MNLYVGNLAYSVTEDNLHELFSNYGEVVSAKLIIDRDTGQSKGFGFVEMRDKSSAETAIKELHDKDVQGRPMKVNEARPRY